MKVFHVPLLPHDERIDFDGLVRIAIVGSPEAVEFNAEVALDDEQLWMPISRDQRLDEEEDDEHKEEAREHDDGVFGKNKSWNIGLYQLAKGKFTHFRGA